jgi:hypothetical protein
VPQSSNSLLTTGLYHTHTHTHTFKRTHLHTITHTHSPTSTHTHTNTHTHTHAATDEYRLDSLHRFGRLDSLELGQVSENEESDLEMGGKGEAAVRRTVLSNLFCTAHTPI